MAEAKAFKMIPHCTKDTIQYEMVELVRCKDCKHKVDTVDDYDDESKCPCYCSGDKYYSWVPDDDWFCVDGKRKD